MMSPEVSRIGPNAVLQTLRALRELEGEEAASDLAHGLPDPATWPAGLIPEAWFVSLVQALRGALPWDRAEDVLRRGGGYTADYVAENRIPGAARRVLRLLPARAGVALLLRAFARHAWTFAGSGRFGFEGPFPGTIFIEGCLTCRPDSGARRGVGEGGPVRHAGAYYEAAFEGLLALAAPAVRVREIACGSLHGSTCRFALALTDPLPAFPPDRLPSRYASAIPTSFNADPPCASS